MKILAFPGVGKTPLSKQRGTFIDLDFGHFREAFGVEKDNESWLVKPFVKLMEKYESDGFVVLSNEPKLMGKTKIDRIYLPNELKYSARKLGVSENQVQEWVNDWKRRADQFVIPVVYLNKGLDHYLRKGSSRKTERGASHGTAKS